LVYYLSQIWQQVMGIRAIGESYSELGFGLYLEGMIHVLT